ncbi:efflux RND transporter permease subunit [Alcanivorax sp. JB21]|uniref:efflux RND transporter permease subunit n=1 Tax=Alcanivorax limicola TaxID=2874102 RepID=UPI001CBD0482|nr:efflux RND transporter permease subunit [Alcanivorax limicola]MBZ2188186.1 efflux RND transporter permease subunit [Alcanivorax limicola]
MIGWFVARPAVANLLMLVLLVAGVLAMGKTRQETLPNVPLDRLGITVTFAQAAPERVEALVCMPLENALYGIEGLSQMVTEAREGLCSITVDIEQGYQTRIVLEQVRTALDGMTRLPANASRPRVQELIVRNRVARLVLTGDLDAMGLYRLARQVRADLLASEAISVVDIESLPDRELALDVRAADLRRHGMSLADMAMALSSGTDSVAGGVLHSDQGDLLLETGQRPDTVADYLAMPLRQSGHGDVLRLGDVARAGDGFARQPMRAWLDGQPAVALDVYRVGRQQVLEVADAIEAYRVGRAWPPGVAVTLWQDDAEAFRTRSEMLWRNALVALSVLALILTFALGLGLARWIALGIPVAMIGACIVMPVLGESFNTISLFAFILVLGIVVDDAIIVGESVHHQRRLGYRGQEAALRGARAVARPVCYAVLTTALAFSPLLFLPGAEGALMRVVPIVAISILVLSLLESLWILPAHLASIPDRPGRLVAASDRLSERFNRFLDGVLGRVYRPAMAHLLRWRYPVVTAFVGMMAITAALLHNGWVNTVLFSEVEADHVLAEVVFPQGTPVSRIEEELARLEASAAQLSRSLEAEWGTRVIDRRLAEQGFREKISNAADPDAAQRMRVSLRLAEGSPLDASTVSALWRGQHGAIADALSTRFDANMVQTRPDVHINLYHEDTAVLDDMAAALADTLRRLSGVHEVTNSLNARRSQVDIALTPAARHAGLTEETLGRQIREAIHGIEVDRMPEQDTEVPVMLRLAIQDTDSLWRLAQMPVQLPGGDWAPLSVMATLTARDAPATYGRYDRRRNATLTAFVDNRVSSPGAVMATLRSSMLDALSEAYPGASWGIAGKPKAINAFMDHLGYTYTLALIAMFFVLTVLFGTWSQPLLVMSVIPFGLVGAVAGHLLLGLDMTLWSIIGVIAVSGVVVNDNLVLIDEVNRLRREQVPLHEAVVSAGAARFRPIMLTTVTTFLGVGPLLLEGRAEAAFLVPMAVSLAFGVLFATLVSLVLVPVLMCAGADIRQWWGQHRGEPVRDVEAAYRQGREAAGWVRNPHSDPVLQAAWDAGRDDRFGGEGAS